MEFMMIRSVKNATTNSGNEIQTNKQALGLISSGTNSQPSNNSGNNTNHLNNHQLYSQQPQQQQPYLNHHGSLSGQNLIQQQQQQIIGASSHAYQQQQQLNQHRHQQHHQHPQQVVPSQQQHRFHQVTTGHRHFQNSSLNTPSISGGAGIKYSVQWPSSTSLTGSQQSSHQLQHWNVANSREPIVKPNVRGALQPPSRGSPQQQHHLVKKKQPTLLPILIKSKETLERIWKGSCPKKVAPSKKTLSANVLNCSGNSSSVSTMNSYMNNNRVYGFHHTLQSIEDFNDNSCGKDLFDVVSPVSLPPLPPPLDPLPAPAPPPAVINPAEEKWMQKLLWESSKESLENINSHPVSNLMFPSFYSKKRDFSISFGNMDTSPVKKKRRLVSSQSMPNLLKPVVKNRLSIVGTQRVAPSSSSSGASASSSAAILQSLNSFRSPGKRQLGSGAIPIRNVFLRKYDPIRLLKRLKAKGSSKTPTAAIIKSLLPRKRKRVVTVNNFPERRRARGDEDEECSSLEGGKMKMKMETRLEDEEMSDNFLDWGLINTPPPATPPEKKRVDNECTEDIKVNVKYKGEKVRRLTQHKVRVSAAVYLKRAVRRLRDKESKERSGRLLQRRLNRETRRSRNRRRRRRKSKKVAKVEQHTGRESKGVVVATQAENGACSVVVAAGVRDKPLAKVYSRFPVTKFKLPKPIPIKTHKISVTDNPLQLHYLELLRHKRELLDRLESVESDGSLQKVGPLPERPKEKRVAFTYDNLPLRNKEAKHVISQKLLICLATVGFTHARLRPLEVLTDATSNFLSQMAERLKQVSEMEMYETDHGFPDSMERVLLERGFGGIRGLEEYYRAKVLGSRQRMEDQCLLLRRQYAYKVRSKVGMMSNLNPSSICASSASTSVASTTTSNIMIGSASSSASSCSSISNHLYSTAGGAALAQPPPSVMVISSASGGGTTSNVGVSGTGSTCTGAATPKASLITKTSASSSSQPLSPGNSVLAEMLASPQEAESVRNPHGCPSSPSLGIMMMGPLSSGTVERQLEELMGAPPPNVEIRPNSFPLPHHHHPHLTHRHSTVQHHPQSQLPCSPQQHQSQQQQQQLPVHHIFASLSQQQSPPYRSSVQQQQQGLLPQQSNSTSLLPPPSPQQQQNPSCRLPPPSPQQQQSSSCRLLPPSPQQQNPSCLLPPPSPQQQQNPSCRLPPPSPQQQQNSSCLLPPPSPQQQQINPYVLYASSPPLTPPTPAHPLNQKLFQSATAPASSCQSPQAPQQSQPSLHSVSLQSPPQNQSHLTQLLQRPITSQQNPGMSSVAATTTTSHHLILHHHHPQQQPPAAAQKVGAPPPPGLPVAVAQPANQYHPHQVVSVGAHLTSPSQAQSPIKNTSINTITGTTTTTKSSSLSQAQLPVHAQQSAQQQQQSPSQHPVGPPQIAAVVHQGRPQLALSSPHQLSIQKGAAQLTSPSAELTYSSNTTTASRSSSSSSNKNPIPNTNGTPLVSNSLQTGGSKLITIIRSSASNHHHPFTTTGLASPDNNVISINLSGLSTTSNTTTSSDPNSESNDISIISSPTAPPSISSTSKAKLKEAISQRNLLRLNFEQVPSAAGDSTVLLSSSNLPPAASSSSNPSTLQFITKVNNPVGITPAVPNPAAATTNPTQSISWNNSTNYS